jgi:hypothetical protein
MSDYFSIFELRKEQSNIANVPLNIVTMNAIINFYDGSQWTTVNLINTSYGVTTKGIVGAFPTDVDGRLNVGILRYDLRDYYITNPFTV